MKKNTRTRGTAAPPANARFVAQQRKKLETLRAHLVRRTDKVDRDLGREQGLEPDFEEQAVTRGNDEVLSALSSEGRDQLTLVDSALARLDAGTYGACTECGLTIARPRLAALPYAALCSGCASERSS